MSNEKPPVEPPEGGTPVDQSSNDRSPDGGADARRAVAKLDFEMGLSLRVIGSKVGVSEAAVRKWAKEGGWVKGGAKPETPVAKAVPPAAPAAPKVVGIRPGLVVVGANSSQSTQSPACEPPAGANCEPDANLGHDQPIDEQFRQRVREMLVNPTRDQAVEVAAAAVVQTVMAHRRGVAKVMAIVDKLAGQLDFASDEIVRELTEQAICEDNPPGKRRNALLALVDLRAHAGTAKDLATAMTKLVQLERQTFGLGMADDPTPPPEPEKLPETDTSVFDTIMSKAKARIAAMQDDNVTDVVAKQ